MLRRRSRRNRRRQRAIATAGAIGGSAAALTVGYKALTSGKTGNIANKATRPPTIPGNPQRTSRQPARNVSPNTPGVNIISARSGSVPQVTVKLDPGKRRDRGLGRLSIKQKNRLENNYGYDFNRRRFRSGVSRSAKRKGVRVLKSLGRFKAAQRAITRFG